MAWNVCPYYWARSSPSTTIAGTASYFGWAHMRHQHSMAPRLEELVGLALCILAALA